MRSAGRSECKSQINADGPTSGTRGERVEVRVLDYTERKKRTMAVLRLAPDGRVVMREHVPKRIEEDLAHLSRHVEQGGNSCAACPASFQARTSERSCEARLQFGRIAEALLNDRGSWVRVMAGPCENFRQTDLDGLTCPLLRLRVEPPGAPLLLAFDD